MEAINKEEAMRAIFLGLVLLCAAAAPSWAADDGGIFARGDANGDGAFDIGDPVYILRFLFSNGGDGDCLDALDVNDDGQINVADAVSALAFLFGEGPPPPPPFLRPGRDETADELTCLRGLQEETILSYSPKQCERDAWDTGFEGKEEARVAAWIESLGGRVSEVRIEYWPYPVCEACGCPRGYSILVRVAGSEAIAQLLRYGFMPIVPVGPVDPIDPVLPIDPIVPFVPVAR
jgi:hypothetical protein